MTERTNGTLAELRAQFCNPSDILSLLLLIGGDVVQQAIAQQFGFWVDPIDNGWKLYLTPVAFSFGWAGYAFTSLASMLGDGQLMPSPPSNGAKIINCETGYSRINRSWVLERLLRDYEAEVAENPGDDYKRIVAAGGTMALRIDSFRLENSENPTRDVVWWSGWLVIGIQLAISTVPMKKDWHDWGPLLIISSGTILALLTGTLPQWQAEKWPSRRLEKRKLVCLTRGNGHRQAMIIEAPKGTWDLEAFASASTASSITTAWFLGISAVLWAMLLIAVSGLKEHTWFLLAIGSLGMVQNIWAGSARRAYSVHCLDLKPCYRSIIAPRQDLEAQDDDTDSEEEERPLIPWNLRDLNASNLLGVRGAIRELEKIEPRAGFALMLEFFPACIRYEPERYRTNKEKKFWKSASRRIGMPVEEGIGQAEHTLPSQ